MSERDLKPFTNSYDKWDTPKFNPTDYYLKPDRAGGGTILKQIMSSIVSSYNDARIKMWQKKVDDINVPIPQPDRSVVWGSNG